MRMVRGSPNPLHMGLAARLRKARKAAGLTRTAVTKKAGGGKAAALYIETAQLLPTVGTVTRLALALGVSPGWLAYGLGEVSTAGLVPTCDDMGARLQAVRIEQGHTKAALARSIQTTPGTVADIENGGQARVNTIEALAKALSISPAWLAFNEGPRELPKRRRAPKSATSARV